MKQFLKKNILALLTVVSLYTNANGISVVMPETVAEIEQLVKTAAEKKAHLTIKGAGKGTSGKSTRADSLVVDLKNLNKILDLNLEAKTITVQAGITWKEIQQAINPFGLAVGAMQSYHDFAVGGSIGVNAHGQDLRFAPVGSTIVSMNLINAQGQRVTLSATENPQLYHAVIGGYGLFGVITHLTLQLTDNTILNKQIKTINVKKDLTALTQETLADDDIALFSARFTIGKKNFFDTLLSITYYDTHEVTKEPLKELSPIKTSVSQKFFELMRSFKFAKNSRYFVERNFIEKNTSTSRNNAMFYSIDHLQEKRSTHIDVLQEYFIPLKNLQKFIDTAKVILKNNKVNLLNCTLRYVKKDTTSMLSYAPETCGALVLYISLENNQAAFDVAQLWTRELINAALEYAGTFYLPYQCFATKEQVRAAYPEFDNFIALKKQYDPQEVFINDLYLNYK